MLRIPAVVINYNYRSCRDTHSKYDDTTRHSKRVRKRLHRQYKHNCDYVRPLLTKEDCRQNEKLNLRIDCLELANCEVFLKLI